MTRGDHGEREPKADLVDWWMGESVYVPQPTSSGQKRLLRALLVVSALAVILVLAKYAIDLLAILVVLTAFGVVLRVVGERAVRSNLLSPGWVWPAVMAVAVALLVAFPVVAPGHASMLSSYAPKAVADFLDWSESHDWGHRVLFTRRATTPVPAAGSGWSAGAEGSEVGARGGNARVSVTASSSTSVAGRAVTFTARLAEGTDASKVVFYDGDARIGAGTVITEGTGRVAYLQVATLPRGTHDITAEIAGPLPPRRSAPIRVTVR